MSTFIVNTTPHDIHVYHDDKITTFVKSDKQIRLVSEEQTIIEDKSLSVPLYTAPNFSDIICPQFPDEVTHLIVSMPVGQYFEKHKTNGRFTILGPDLGPVAGVRDERGQPIGTRRLVLYQKPNF